jgi:putative intracellular protease/amidase
MPKSKEFRQAMVDGDAQAATAAAADWQYGGYQMTVFSDDEEIWAEENILDGEKVPFYPADALTAAGGNVETQAAFESHAVQDRELITGQNPYSDTAFTDLFIQALNRASSR